MLDYVYLQTFDFLVEKCFPIYVAQWNKQDQTVSQIAKKKA